MTILVLDVSYFMSFLTHMSVTLAERMLDTTFMFLIKFADARCQHCVRNIVSRLPRITDFATLVRIINTRIPAASHV